MALSLSLVSGFYIVMSWSTKYQLKKEGVVQLGYIQMDVFVLIVCKPLWL